MNNQRRDYKLIKACCDAGFWF